MTFTPRLLPLPLSEPDVAERTSHALLPAFAVQVTGRAQVPVSLKVTFAAEDCPWETKSGRFAGDGDDSIQGGKTVSVTEKDCGLP